MKATSDMSVEELQSIHEDLVKGIRAATELYMSIEAEYNANKRQLKEKLDQARKDGFDPDKLDEEIQHYKEVVALKLNTSMVELEEADKMMRPMKQVIEGI